MQSNVANACSTLEIISLETVSAHVPLFGGRTGTLVSHNLESVDPDRQMLVLTT